MSIAKAIRYKTKTESADENERLIRAVFSELAESKPEGLKYVALRLDDSISFLHVAVLEGEDNPLSRSAAFAEFQSGIADRCIEGPVVADGAILGSYSVFSET